MRAGGGERVAWLDVTAGVAGDMLLGALVDAGADLGAVQHLVDLVLPDTVRLDAAQVRRAGLRAVQVKVTTVRKDHPHRSWREIRDRIAAAGLPGPVAESASAVFRRLAEVEATTHGEPVDEVEFHEVGAWDSIADVIGTCGALQLLGVEDIVATTLALGSGTVRTAHGVLPVPVPAVLGLVDGWSVEAGGEGELATPTGVALVTTLATSQGDLPALEALATGVGAGSRDAADRPNVVRVVLGRRAAAGAGTVAVPMTVLEANVDDLDPRVWPTVLAALLDAGAADAWLTPILMKKGRPAHTVSVLSTSADVEELREEIFRLTSTIGVREAVVYRRALERGWVDVLVDGQPVAVKVAHREGVVVRATPEFDDVARVAAEVDRPVQDVLAAAVAGTERAGLKAGASVTAQLRPTHTRSGKAAEPTWAPKR
ncbi:MAG TPA: nickel pincer cofactor biosynthesis protein LarC [Lapillicoccus sp.]|nr:nickel pincer cofactor biosynthesis protein LarC [Lapillicoccus sp.]